MMLKKDSKVLWIVSIFVIGFVFLYAVLFYHAGNGICENLMKGETGYTQELGLINWGHAREEGTVKAFRSLQDLNKSAVDSFEYHYSQKLVSEIWYWKVVVECFEKRKVPAHLSSEQEKIVLLELFTSVSGKFESMQAEFPLMLVPGAIQSSFRPGDLMGNLVSYYAL